MRMDSLKTQMNRFITQNVSVVELDKLLHIPETAYNEETVKITRMTQDR